MCVHAHLNTFRKVETKQKQKSKKKTTPPKKQKKPPKQPPNPPNNTQNNKKTPKEPVEQGTYCEFGVGSVLWWISFQVITPSFPVVRELPIVNTNFLSKATFSISQISFPRRLFGRYAVLVIPLYGDPGLGWLLWKQARIQLKSNV